MRRWFRKYKKRIIVSLAIIFVIMAVTALSVPAYFCCRYYYIQEIKPDNQMNTLWVSEWPRVCIEVRQEPEKTTGGNTIAKIRFQEGEKESEVIFSRANIVYFVPMQNDLSKYQLKTKSINELCYFSGKCKFYRDKMVVKIMDDHIFNGEYDEVTFIKEALDHYR